MKRIHFLGSVTTRAPRARREWLLRFEVMDSFRWIVMIAAVLVAMVRPVHAADVQAPRALKMEGASQLFGTDIARPRLSWLAPPRFSGLQSAYQVRVALSIGELNTKPLWDSGRIDSSANSLIEYSGPALQSRHRYYWQVKAWDARGRATRWSEPSSWEMGLLSPTDWQAQWIGGRQQLDHDWSDARVTFEFTLLGSSIDFLFRARPIGKTYGESYVWRLAMSGDRAVLTPHVRHYTGRLPTLVATTALKSGIALPLTQEQLRGGRQRLTIEMRGERINTLFNDIQVDSLTDASQSSGTIGVVAGNAQAVLHSVAVESSEQASFRTAFERNDNPFTGGSVRNDGLLVAAGVRMGDIVLPIAAPAPLLRRDFTLDAGIRSARLYVAAGGFPRIVINGKSANTTIADGFTAYDKRVLYRTVDVTSLLHEGRNAIGAELGRGWYGITEPNEWYWHAAPWHAPPTLLLQLEVLLRDGTRRTIASDASWRTLDGPTLHDSIYAGERFDARRSPAGWAEAQFDDARWAAASLVKGPVGVLDAAEQEPIDVVQRLRPLAIREVKPGIYVYDFGRIFAGRVRLRAQGPAGQTISLIHTEKLNADGTVVILGGLVDAQLQTDRYTLAGRGQEEWAAAFGYKGFRYVQVEGFPGTPDLDTLTGEVMHSSVAALGQFESSNALLNAIHAAARNSISNNLHGMQTDTPTYEKNGWTGDAHASALASAINFDVSRVWTKWMADFRDAQSPQGEIPEIVPSTPMYGYEVSPGWSMVQGPVPSWDAATLVLPADLYQLTGDRRLLEQMYETQRKLVDYTGRFFKPDTYVWQPKQPRPSLSMRCRSASSQRSRPPRARHPPPPTWTRLQRPTTS